MGKPKTQVKPTAPASPPNTATDQTGSAEQPTVNQPLLEHIIELRSKLIYCIAAIFAIFGCLFYFSNDIYEFVAKPIMAQLPKGEKLIAIDITATFFAPFKLTLVLSFFLSMPFIMYQFWSFVAPGLYSNEKKIAFPILFMSIALFYTGVAFAYFVIFPLVMQFFTAISPESVAVTPDISQYLNIALKLFFAFGLAFQIPVITMACIWMGVAEAENLKEKRPYIIVSCFVFAMLLTPPDPASQLFLAIPMWLLFELGLVLGKLKKS